MALIDWNVFKSNNNTVSGIDFITPIVGVGSLFINRGISESSVVNIVPADTGIHPHGRNTGRLRTLVRWDSQEGQSNNHGMWVGILCLQSHDNLTQGIGSAYGFGLYTSEGFQDPVFKLYKFNNVGISKGVILEELAVSEIPTLHIGIGIPFSLQLEWISNLAVLGGVQLICSVGKALDFSDLYPQISYIDITSPLLTGINEGLVVKMESNDTNSKVQVAFDQTTLFELT